MWYSGVWSSGVPFVQCYVVQWCTYCTVVNSALSSGVLSSGVWYSGVLYSDVWCNGLMPARYFTRWYLFSILFPCQAHADIASLLVKSVCNPLLEISACKRNQAKKLCSFREEFENMLQTAEETVQNVGSWRQLESCPWNKWMILKKLIQTETK